MDIRKVTKPNYSWLLGAKERVVVIATLTLAGAILGWLYAPAIMNSFYNWVSSSASIKSQTNPEAAALGGPSSPIPAFKKKPDSKPLRAADSVRDDVNTPQDSPFNRRTASPLSVLGLTVLGGMLGAYLGFQLLTLSHFLTRKWEKTDATDRIVLVGGLIVGIVIASPFIVFLQTVGISSSLLPWCYLIVLCGTMTISVYILGQIADMIPSNRGRGPVRRTGIKLLDTNVIIDGRIYDVAKNGFLEGQMYLPRFVLEELQHIADHPDALKRQRGKRGLEVLKQMQVDFEIDAGSKDHFAADASEPVDSRLVRLARAIGADLVTNDHNLNRVASLQNVRVLNINDLALSLRPNVLPSERLVITIVKEGNQLGQGVGYLDDGTMVVVENGRNHLGETCELTVTQVIQTERGKMIFGEIYEDEEEEAYQQRRRTVTHAPTQRRV